MPDDDDDEKDGGHERVTQRIIHNGERPKKDIE